MPLAEQGLAPEPKLPTVVVGGYLGAGKTTLVNHLLRHADGRRIAVMVNDFGEIGIDADLIVSADGDVLNLAGGCICCSFGSDLVEALMALPRRVPRPDLVLIETSGVALPAQAAAAARLAPGIAVESTVVLVDVETILEQVRDRFVGDTVRRQLEQAEVLLLNKTDLIGREALTSVEAWLARTAPLASRVRTQRSAVPLALLYATDADLYAEHLDTTPQDIWTAASVDTPEGTVEQPVTCQQAPPAHTATAVFSTCSFVLNRTVCPQAMAARLAAPDAQLLRFKGLVRDAAGQWHAVQGVGRRHEVWALAEDHPAPAQQGQGALVCIATAPTDTPDGLRARIMTLIEGLDPPHRGNPVARRGPEITASSEVATPVQSLQHA